MPEDIISKLEIPKSAQPQSQVEDFVIHVMPQEFATRKATVQQVVPDVKPPVVVAKPTIVVPPVKPPLKPPVKPKKRSKFWFIFLAILLILLAAGIVGGYFLWQSLQTTPVVEEEIIPEETPEEVEEPIEPIINVTRGKDTDSDGLTDIEEALYGTDFRNPDTDADTYLDGNEVYHLYDPLGFAPSTLLDTGTVAIYEDSAGRYSVEYPVKWSVEPIVGGVRFHSNSETYFEIMSFEKSPTQDFETWYAQEVVPTNGDVDLKAMVSKGGYPGFTTNDERTAYLYTDDRVYVFSYVLGKDILVSYLQTFKMLINSFKINS